MKLKRFFSIICCAVLLMSISSTAFAAEYKHEDFTIEIPDNMYQITSETSVYDTVWDETGLNAEETLTNISNTDTYVQFVRPEDGMIVLVRFLEESYYETVYNFGDYDLETRQEILDYLVGTDSETVQTTSELIEHPQIPFFKFLQSSTGDDGTIYYDLVYGTIYNGQAVFFETYSVGEELSDEQISFLEEIVQSANFNEFLPTPDNSLTQADVIKFVAFLVLIIAIIVGLIVSSRRRKNSDKRQKKEMAEKLSEYRKTHPENQTTSEMRYANVTNCSDVAIKKFSIYNSYLKNLIPIIFGSVMCIVLVILAFFVMTDGWVMKLLAAGIVLYYLYKMITLGGETEKTQKKIYTRGTSRVAKYIFYDEEFKVSGIQHVTVYPYFQITDVREKDGYFYLYYGPENAYIVNKNEFVSGNPEDFKQFIIEKSGMKKKK